MRTYYRGPDVVVTGYAFMSRTAPGPFQIHELRNVGITRTEAHTGRLSAAQAIGFLLMISLAAWPLWTAKPAYALILIGFSLPALAIGALCWRSRPWRFQLHATYRGQPKILFSTSDERIFNQVTRALRRAIEDAESAAQPKIAH